MVASKKPPLSYVDESVAYSIARNRWAPIAARTKNRGFIDKSHIAEEEPLLSCLLNKNESLITRWMANRYITTALPDEFEIRIKKQKAKLSKVFANEIGATCKAVYISLNEFILDLKKSEKYICKLVFILSDASYEKYVEEEDSNQTFYNDFIKRIEEIFKSAEGIEFARAIFISEKAFTIHQAESQKLKKFQFDYISMAKGGEMIIPTL